MLSLARSRFVSANVKYPVVSAIRCAVAGVFLIAAFAKLFAVSGFTRWLSNFTIAGAIYIFRRPPWFRAAAWEAAVISLLFIATNLAAYLITGMHSKVQNLVVNVIDIACAGAIAGALSSLSIRRLLNQDENPPLSGGSDYTEAA